MPKVMILPHYHYERMLGAFLEPANYMQADFRFYLEPPDEKAESPLRKAEADYMEILPYLEGEKKRRGLNRDDLLIAFYDGVITANDHGLRSLFIAGANLDDPYPCTAVVSLQFIQWDVLEKKFDYSLQRYALFHLVMCALISSYTKAKAHNETYGCLLDFNNELVGFNKKLQMGYYLCSDRQRGCFHTVREGRFGNSITALCSRLKDSIEQSQFSVTIQELILGDKFENIANSTIINRAIVENAFNEIRGRIDDETAIALVSIAEAVDQSGNVAAGTLFENFLTEVREDKPSKLKLQQWWKALLAVLPNLATLAEAGEKIAKLFNP